MFLSPSPFWVMGLTFFTAVVSAMSHWSSRFKPGVSQKTHLFCASALWTVIGFFLIYRGIVYLSGDNFLPLALLGIILGSLKSSFILNKSAARGVERIRRFGDNTCIGAVYSWQTWVLVAVMMVLGVIIRMSPVPSPVVGTVCVAIGWALLYSSRYGWQQWFFWHK